MATKEELVNYYYKKCLTLINKRKQSFVAFPLPKIKVLLKESIEEIISMDREYLLTDSFINYFTFSDFELVATLKQITSPSLADLYIAVKDYFIHPLFTCINYNGNINKTYYEYIKIMDDNMKDTILRAYEVCDDLFNNYRDDIPNGADIVLCMLSTYFILDHNMDSFNDMINKFETNPLSLVSHLRSLGIDIKYTYLADSIENGKIIREYYSKKGPIIS